MNRNDISVKTQDGGTERIPTNKLDFPLLPLSPDLFVEKSVYFRAGLELPHWLDDEVDV